MNCPIKLDKIHCANCAFSKESLCDYPYHQGMTLEQIKKVIRGRK